ncbi:MAG: redoxin domain-containing protein [Planctomycetota bacterium]|nr:redoxin domain-containing protein [Planctomycetota bacterium]
MYVDMIRMPAPSLDGGTWLQSPPLSLDGFRGRPVCIDFWDYTSLPSLAGIPYLRQWHKRYQSFGTAFIGVHVPSYPFGGERENVEAAIRRLQIPYPVVIDDQGAIRKSFGIQSVPCRYIVDHAGFLRFYQIGDEDYENTELFLQQTLREMDSSLEMPGLQQPLRVEDRVGGFTLPSTPEIVVAESIGNPDDVKVGREGTYEIPASLEDGRAYLSGRWEKSERARVLSGEGGVRVIYKAAEVFLLAAHSSRAELEVRLDGQPVEKAAHGEDLSLAPGGEVRLVVDRPRPYQVLRHDGVERHDLEIRASSPGLEIYSIQFASRMPPL